MKNKKVYIFNIVRRATLYGVGTYINQLTACLKKSEISFEVIILHAEGNETSTSFKDGFRTITIPQVEYRTPNDATYYYRNVAYLLDEYIIQDEKTECIFHLNFMTNLLLISNLKKRFKCKIVLVCHYTEWSLALFGNKEKLLTLLKKDSRKRTLEEKQIYKNVREDEKMIYKCDRFICVAEHTLDTFKKISQIDPSKCVVIHNGLEDEYKSMCIEKKKSVKDKYWIPKDTKILLFVGRLDEMKGISYLIKAFKNLLKKRSNIHLFLVGDGNFPQWLKESGNCWTKISFTGRLNKQKIKDLYQIADIGVVSSIHEEFGLVAIEMMMHQLPVIVGDTGGLAEIVENGISGIKIPVRTVKGKKTLSHKSLTDAIEFLLSNEEIADNIAKNGRSRFLQNYEMNLFKEKMLNLYHEI